MRSKKIWAIVGALTAVVAGVFIFRSQATVLHWPLGYHPVISPNTRPPSAKNLPLVPVPVDGLRIAVADFLDRAHRLRSMAPPFERINLGPHVRTFYYRPVWRPDELFVSTQTGRIFVTYWPPLPGGGISRVPEYIGALWHGNLSPLRMPRSAYYSIAVDNYAGPIPIFDATTQYGEHDHFGILPNGSIIPANQIPAQLRGYNLISNPLKQCVHSGATLYAVPPNGAPRPILSDAAWREATHGLWPPPVACAARFGGEYYVETGNHQSSTLLRIWHGRALVVGAAWIAASTDNVMILLPTSGIAIIEAYLP